MVIDSAAVRKGVFAFMQQAADAAGTLDPVAALAGAPADSSIIYVSDGHPIRGFEFQGVLRRFFGTLVTHRMVVTRAEITPLTGDLAMAVFWMTATSQTKAGRSTLDSLIETAVYERKDGKWRPLLWHKTTLR